MSLLSSIFGRKSTTPTAIVSPKASGPSHSAASVTGRAAIPAPAPSSTKLAAPSAAVAPAARIVAPIPKTPSREIVEALVKYQIIDADPSKLEPLFNANNGTECLGLDKDKQQIMVLNDRGLWLISRIILELGIKSINATAIDEHINSNADAEHFNSLLRGFFWSLSAKGIDFKA
jgi:hypothetical protein